MNTGQWFVDSTGKRWFFDSGSLALDFAYTGDLGYDNPDWERLHSTSDLEEWLTDRFGVLTDATSKVDFATAFTLRRAITGIARAYGTGTAPLPNHVDDLNDIAAHAAIAPHLTGGTAPAVPTTPRRALASIAHHAISTFESGPERIRCCGASDCNLIFHDSSRPNARRWCSMKRCGNRTKIRNYRAKA